MKILITGSKGFIGKNLIVALNEINKINSKENFDYIEYDKESSLTFLKDQLKSCDFVVHLAGVNRTTNKEEFYEGNSELSQYISLCLKEFGNKAPVLVSSSIQVGKNNDYAFSKEQGEKVFIELGKSNGNPIYIYRFPNLFGKWSKPNYNSVISTWCYNISRNKEISIHDSSTILTLCYIDDVIYEIVQRIQGKGLIAEKEYYSVHPQYRVSLEKIYNLLQKFKESRETYELIDQKDEFTKKLYATYLSYLPTDKFKYSLHMNNDERGSFTEFLKSNMCGQVSINITKPGITKGNHWHHTKNEKFLVVSGRAIIQLRNILEQEKTVEIEVSGAKLEVVDIPVGYTHNIINLGNTDLVTIMWANEAFDKKNPDTYFEEVVR